MISSRKLEDLHPLVADKCAAFLLACSAKGIEVIVTSTYRDEEYQNSLYAQGRTTPGSIVTNARGGQSYHNFKVAFDFVPVIHVPSGKGFIPQCQFNDMSLITQCGEIGESLGLEWAGRWVTFREYLHLQYTDGLTLVDFREGKDLPYPQPAGA